MDRSEYGNKLMKGYSWRNLYNMRLFYIIFSDNQILQTLSAKLTWSHYTELVNMKDLNKINYYINVSISQNLSVRQLKYKIKNNEYERLDDKTKEKLGIDFNM